MEQYKTASRLRLRFQTDKGALSVEQLWDLTTSDLDKLAVALDKEYEDSKGKSFIQKKRTKDAVTKIKFDIVIDILETKITEQEAAKKSQENKALREKITNIIAEKQDEALSNKSMTELKKLLKETEEV